MESAPVAFRSPDSMSAALTTTLKVRPSRRGPGSHPPVPAWPTQAGRSQSSERSAASARLALAVPISLVTVGVWLAQEPGRERFTSAKSMLLPFLGDGEHGVFIGGDGLGLLRHGGDGVVAPGRNGEVAQRVVLPGFRDTWPGAASSKSRIRPSATLVAVSLPLSGE